MRAVPYVRRLTGERAARDHEVAKIHKSKIKADRKAEAAAQAAQAAAAAEQAAELMMSKATFVSMRKTRCRHLLSYQHSALIIDVNAGGAGGTRGRPAGFPR